MNGKHTLKKTVALLSFSRMAKWKLTETFLLYIFNKIKQNPSYFCKL